MIRVLETYYRHRRLLLIPLLLSLLVSLGYALHQPRSYESSSSLWFQRGLMADGTDPFAEATPAGVQVSALQELLSTRSFCVKAGRRGPLAGYLAHQATSAGPSPAALTQGPAPGRATTSPAPSPALDNLLYTTINGSARVAAAGPDVVTVSMTAPDPHVAAGTVQAIVDQFGEELSAVRHGQARYEADFYSARLKTAQAAITDAENRMNDYIGAHPEAAGVDPLQDPLLTGVAPDPLLLGATQDPQLISLRRAVTAAGQRYQTLQDRIDQAKLELADPSGASGFRVLDRAEPATAPLGFRQRLTYAAGAGGVVGAFLLLVLLLVLSWMDRTMHRAGEVEASLGLVVGGTIPLLSEFAMARPVRVVPSDVR